MPDFQSPYLDKALTQVSLFYRNANLALLNLFPRVPVDLPSSRYWVYGFEAFHLYDDARRPGALAKEMPDWSLSTDTYLAEENALARLIPDQVRAMAQVNIDVVTTQQMTDALLLRAEKKAHDMLASGVVPNTTLSGTSQWSDYVNSDPLLAVENQKPVVFQAVAKIPNVFACSYPVYLKLRQHPKLIDRFKYGAGGIGSAAWPGFLTQDQLKTVFDVDQFIVLGALYDATGFGQNPTTAFTFSSGSATLSYIWGKDALLAYIPPQPAQMEVSLGYSFWWTGVQGAVPTVTSPAGGALPGVPLAGGGPLIRRYRFEPRKGDMLEAEAYYDLKIVAPGAGYYWINASA